MRMQRIVPAMMLVAALATWSGCGDDDSSGPAPTATSGVPTSTRTATAVPPTSTQTSVPNTPTATAVPNTPTATLAPSDTPTSGPDTPTPTETTIVADTPTSTPTPTDEAPATPTETPTQSSGGGLGVRLFNVTRPGSGFNTSALAGFDVSLDPWLPATLKLEAGQPDENGVATLTLKEDVIVGLTVVDTSLACFKLVAAGSTGTVSCNGGVPQNATLTQDRNEGGTPGPIVIATGVGDPSPAGSASFTLMQAVVNLPAGSDIIDCIAAEYPPADPAVFTTGNGKATALNTVQGGDVELARTGEPFDCANWTSESGPGQLVGPIVGFNPLAGDVANTLFLAGREPMD